MPRTIRRAATPLLLFVSLSACGKSSSPTSPTPPPVTHPYVTISAINVTAAASANRFSYSVVLTLKETAGVAATISSVQLTFLAGTQVVASSRHDQPLATGTTCPPSGSIETKALITTDSDGDPYATSVQAIVSFTDGSAFSASMTATADVPPLPTPPPPVTYTLTGVITDAATHAPIENARMDVLNGDNAGKTTVTDAQGFYTMRDLAAETFRLRASAVGYFPGEQNVTVPTVPRADFELRRSVPEACVYTVAGPPSTNLPFQGGEFSIAITRSSGSCGWSAASDASWLTPAAPSGNGTTTLLVRYAVNASFVGRLGTITVAWDGGSARIAVGQNSESPVVCRMIFVSVNGQNPLTVPAAGGRFSAAVTTEPGVPQGVCGPWTALGSAAISFPGPSSAPQVPGSVTFDVQPNASGAARALQISIAVTPFGPSAVLAINQSGAP